jgi:hypothetical protein
MSRQVHGSVARARWSWATGGGEACTALWKLKKTARSSAAGVLALSSLEKDLEIISSPSLIRIFGVIYNFIGYW